MNESWRCWDRWEASISSLSFCIYWGKKKVHLYFKWSHMPQFNTELCRLCQQQNMETAGKKMRYSGALRVQQLVSESTVQDGTFWGRVNGLWHAANENCSPTWGVLLTGRSSSFLLMKDELPKRWHRSRIQHVIWMYPVTGQEGHSQPCISFQKRML